MPETGVRRDKIQSDGFFVMEDVYTSDEVYKTLDLIQNADSSNPDFRRSADLFAIRRFLSEVSEARDLIFNGRLKNIISDFSGADYHLIKSIYYDKPPQSNWFVPWHQDLTISVNKKIECEGFSNWTVKHNQCAVQPPVEFLENIVTIRIHLDDTDEANGALRVVAGSHHNGIIRNDAIAGYTAQEATCNVKSGGIMIMKPLLLHASNRTINNKRRRVIHLEFSDRNLPWELEWAEA